VSKDGIIGIDGKLPWKLPQDRRAFKDLTRGKVLVIGRKTLEELSGSTAHIRHAAHTIVISGTMDEGNDNAYGAHVVRSLPDALALARELVQSHAAEKGALDVQNDQIISSDSETALTIGCWVAGGERVYEQALVHPSADRLHLTVVDMEVLGSGVDGTRVDPKSVARFPVKYRWDNRFRLISQQNRVDETSGISYCEYVYRRIRGQTGV